MWRFILAFAAIVGLAAVAAKDEYLVSGVKTGSRHPFGLSPDIMETVPHDKCAVSVPVPGNDDSMTLVGLGINRAVWVRHFNGEEWGEWISLNGTSSSGPSAIRDEKDQLHVFIRGLDGLIWHRFEKDGEWSDWLHLGNVKTTTGPVAVINSEGLISVFALGSNKAVWVNTQEGLSDSEGVCTSGKAFPTAEQESRPENGESIATSDTGFDEDSASHKDLDSSFLQLEQDEDEKERLRQELIANATAEANREWARVDSLKASSDSVKEIKYVWSGWENLGGVWTNKPSVTINNEGLLSVFVRGVDRSIYVASQETSAEHGLVWSDWVWLKGNFASAPKVSAITMADGMSVLTVRGMDKSFYMKKQSNDVDGVEWGQWDPVGGLWTSGPTVLSPNSDTVDLFGLGLDLSVWHKVYSSNADGEMFWSAPECLQGRFSSSVSVAKDTSGQMHVFTRGFDQAIWYKSQSPDGNNVATWGNWTSLGGAMLHFPC
jgi:hypothetical protein